MDYLCLRVFYRIQMDWIIEDKELGKLIIRVNPRAKRFIFRALEQGIVVTVPSNVSRTELDGVIDELRPKLLHLAQEKPAPQLIDFNFELACDLFSFKVLKGAGTRVYANIKPNSMEVICHESTDFSDENLQAWLRKAIEEGMRRSAKIDLPMRLIQLATANNFSFNEVKITSSLGRWGSCSARKNISLSLYLLLLPKHLIDYVLLHELCHTVELNHSDRFWDLLNGVTAGKALALREELKNYRTAI